jgi:hypothetical protein
MMLIVDVMEEQAASMMWGLEHPNLLHMPLCYPLVLSEQIRHWSLEVF